MIDDALLGAILRRTALAREELDAVIALLISGLPPKEPPRWVGRTTSEPMNERDARLAAILSAIHGAIGESMREPRLRDVDVPELEKVRAHLDAAARLIGDLLWPDDDEEEPGSHLRLVWPPSDDDIPF